MNTKISGQHPDEKSAKSGPAEPGFVKTDPETGLSNAQAAAALKNTDESSSIKPVSVIIREHVFTFFNLLNLVLAGLVVLTGSWRNLLFMGVVIGNTLIGLYQELHSRKILSRLAIISQAKFHVLRESRIEQIPADEIALGDVLILEQGNQVPVDGVLLSGALQVNESALTGEQDDIDKEPGDPVSSGCFVTAGKAKMQVTAVGSETWLHKVTQEARRSRRYPSQLRDSLNQIIHFCTIILIPTGVLLFLKMILISHTALNSAILAAVASMVGMIPEGLVILTSVALAVSSARLAKEYVLVQELYCIETLARVSVLCLDKTGTITTGNMKVQDVIAENGFDRDECVEAISSLYHALDDQNATATALREWTKDVPVKKKAENVFPFSSSNKFSGAAFSDCTWIAGAYSFVFEKEDPEILKQIESYAKEGIRVLVLARAPKMEKLKKGNYELAALILIQDEIRPDAPEILSYFEKQDVRLKIISGDMPATVAALAARAGVKGKSFDMSSFDPNKDRLQQIMQDYSIFGRVTPEQKREMVLALKQNGETVAMTGDGVNDVLALKEADCSIAMGTGTQAARSVASLVLLKDQFGALPSILMEGRRVINNIQRTASLFLVKTLFSFGLSVMTLFFLSRYPFQPIQLTLVSFLGVGFPSFVLTLEPNHARVEGNFLVNVLSRAIPGALCVIVMVMLTKIVSGFLNISPEQFSTIATWAAGFNALWVLYFISLPLTTMRKVLLGAMTVCFFFAMIFLSSLFEISVLSWQQYAYVALLACAIPFFLSKMFDLNWKRMLSLRVFRDPGQKKTEKNPAARQ